MSKPVFYQQTRFRIFIGLAAFFLLLISVLPYALQYGLQRWFIQQGATAATVEDIDLNLFTGKLSLTGLRVTKAGKQTLQIQHASTQIDWLPLFSKRIFISAVNLQGIHLTAEQTDKKNWLLGGIPLPTANTPQTVNPAKNLWHYTLNAVTLADVMVALKTPVTQADFSVRQMSLDKLASGTGTKTRIALHGKINQAAISLNARLQLFTPERVISGTLSMKDFDLSLLALQVAGHRDKLGGQLSLSSQFSLKQLADKQIRLTTRSQLQLANLDFQQDQQRIIQDKLTWNGNSNSAFTADFRLKDYSIEGQLGSENLVITPQQPYHYHHERLNWEGRITAGKNPLSAPRVTGDLSVTGLELLQRNDGLELFSTKTLDISHFRIVSAEEVLTDNIRLTGLRSFFRAADSRQKQKPALIQAGELLTASLAFKPGKTIHLGKTQLQDALIYIHRQKNGQIKYLSQFGTSSKQTRGTETPPEQAHVILAAFSLTGKSRIRLIDDAVSPAFNTELGIEKATIGLLDSLKPDTGSPFSLMARLDTYSTIALHGQAYPFTKKINLQLEGDLKGISLPPLSSYSASAIGYNLRSGQLNAHIKAAIKQGKIDAHTRMKLSNLEVRSAGNQQSENLTSQLSMPLDSALSLLRNRNNDIELELPIKGNTDNPDFQIGGIINTAIATAMKKATMTYLIHALQPYGSLITIAKLVKSASSAVTLNPVTFSPASTQLDSTALAYLEKILHLMQQRPALRIKVCGVATEADRKAIAGQMRDRWVKKHIRSNNEGNKQTVIPEFRVSDDTLLKLARDRSGSIKSALVKQKINAERLFLCNPELDRKTTAKPRVDLSI